jgi:hypothetical protein
LLDGVAVAPPEPVEGGVTSGAPPSSGALPSSDTTSPAFRPNGDESLSQPIVKSTPTTERTLRVLRITEKLPFTRRVGPLD